MCTMLSSVLIFKRGLCGTRVLSAQGLGCGIVKGCDGIELLWEIPVSPKTPIQSWIQSWLYFLKFCFVEKWSPHAHTHAPQPRSIPAYPSENGRHTCANCVCMCKYANVCARIRVRAKASRWQRNHSQIYLRM